jgi:hypothetical protein
VYVANPPAIVPVPRVAEPSRNVTVPLADDGETVAVKITLWPTVEGLPEVMTDVVVGTLPTVTADGADVLAALLVSPLYAAVSEWRPTVRDDVVIAEVNTGIWDTEITET